MATVKRLLSDIDNKIEAENKKINPKQVYEGAAPKPKKEPTNPYFNKEKYGKYFDENYQLKPEMREEYLNEVDFEDFPKENKTQKINPKPVAKPTAINPANVLKEAKTGKENPKLDHIKEYFSIWGNPGPREFDEVVKFYGLGDEDASELRKHFGYDKPKPVENAVKGPEKAKLSDFEKQQKDFFNGKGNPPGWTDPDDLPGGKNNPLSGNSKGKANSAPAGLITRENRGEFLKKNNYKNFYWDGNDLVYGPTGENVYLMSNSGVSEDELRKELDAFRPDPRDMRDEVRKIETELGTQIRDMASYDRVAKELMDRDLAISREQARNMVDEYIGADLAERINAEREDELTKYDGYAPVEPRRDNRINPRQVYQNASNAKPRTNSEIIDQSSRDISAELDAQLKNGQISKEEWQEKKANLEAFDRSRKVRAELERKTGRKYSDDEWAAIVELASQLR